MHFAKVVNFTKNNSEFEFPNAQKVDLSEHKRAFDFIPSIYSGKQEHLFNLYKTDNRLLSDIAASVMKQIYLDGYLHKEKFKAILTCIQDIIIDLGYAELTQTDFSNFLTVPKNETHNIMIIAGCQNTPMLDARIEKAVEIAEIFSNNINIVASGASPNPSRAVKIQNESKRMINIFETKIKNIIPDPSKRPRIDIIPEGESHNTNSNIEKFFEGNFLKRDLKNQIIIVSSSSHLIRLSKEVEKYIEENKSKLNFNISNIILAGAESIDKKFFIDNDHLFKHMMLEIYDYFIEDRMKSSLQG